MRWFISSGVRENGGRGAHAPLWTVPEIVQLEQADGVETLFLPLNAIDQSFCEQSEKNPG